MWGTDPSGAGRHLPSQRRPANEGERWEDTQVEGMELFLSQEIPVDVILFWFHLLVVDQAARMHGVSD